MKQLVWLLAVVTLIVGRRHFHSDRWVLLAVLLVIDFFSTPLLNRDLMRKGIRLGNPGREIAKEVASQIGDEGKKSMLKGVGVPEHLVEGYFLSKDARGNEEEKWGLGSRVWANIVWTFLIAGISIYSLIKGF
jgi:hypothetical protein